MVKEALESLATCLLASFEAWEVVPWIDSVAELMVFLIASMVIDMLNFDK